MWGSDYPHFDGGWPNAAERLAAQFDGVPFEDQVRIGRTNCIDFYDLPLSPESRLTGDELRRQAEHTPVSQSA
jgi:hypothetical protein